MRHLVLSVLLCCLLAPLHAEAQKQQRQPTPVVVELFHSEGCSSCPQVEQFITQLQQKAIEQKAPVVCLSYHVDYWDKLGWKDPYADPAWTARQDEYVKALRLPGRVTPAVIVNGHVALQAPGYKVITQLLMNEYTAIPTAAVGITAVSVAGGKATVGVKALGRTEGLDLRVAVVEGGLVSKITAGENKGQTLKHELTVRALHTGPLAEGGEQEVELALPEGLVPDHSRVIAFLQDPVSLRIHGAAGRNLTDRSGGAEATP